MKTNTSEIFFTDLCDFCTYDPELRGGDLSPKCIKFSLQSTNEFLITVDMNIIDDLSDASYISIYPSLCYPDCYYKRIKIIIERISGDIETMSVIPSIQGIPELSFDLSNRTSFKISDLYYYGTPRFKIPMNGNKNKSGEIKISFAID